MEVDFKLGHKVIFLHLRATLVKAYVNKLKNNTSVNFSLFHILSAVDKLPVFK